MGDKIECLSLECERAIVRVVCGFHLGPISSVRTHVAWVCVWLCAARLLCVCMSLCKVHGLFAVHMCKQPSQEYRLNIQISEQL